MEGEIEVARVEDEWDSLMKGLGVGSNRREVGWETGIREALREVVLKLEGEGEKNTVMARKMVGIIDGEKRLADEERKIRVMEKNEQKRKRKEEGKSEGGGKEMK